MHTQPLAFCTKVWDCRFRKKLVLQHRIVHYIWAYIKLTDIKEREPYTLKMLTVWKQIEKKTFTNVRRGWERSEEERIGCDKGQEDAIGGIGEIWSENRKKYNCRDFSFIVERILKYVLSIYYHKSIYFNIIGRTS